MLVTFIPVFSIIALNIVCPSLSKIEIDQLADMMVSFGSERKGAFQMNTTALR